MGLDVAREGSDAHLLRTERRNAKSVASLQLVHRLARLTQHTAHTPRIGRHLSLTMQPLPLDVGVELHDRVSVYCHAVTVPAALAPLLRSAASTCWHKLAHVATWGSIHH